ncbi:MAG: TonB-dependent receptor plug domain-containing protein [Fibrobacteraceae bacterium]|nr:TonB-dependent receptor plug domain-containing protein [Fibrobacteraceae bacterium]
MEYTEPTAETTAPADTLVKSILFKGVVKDDNFAPTEKLNVEILETGEALQTRVGEAFSVQLPKDTLWNICVTNSDTSGSDKEKCYEVVYLGSDSTFSMELGAPDSLITQFDDGSIIAENPLPPDSTKQQPTAADKNATEAAATDATATNSAAQDEDISKLLDQNDKNITELKKVVVQLRRRPKRKPGESVVTAKSIKRMPGLAEADVIRSIQALPGVVASSDFSTKIYVRGGAADQNLFLYDNSVVYSPTHFFGLFSTFLVETIDDVEFYKSGFPAQYGNRLSSVLRINGRAGGQDTVEEWLSKSSLKISTFAAQLHTEGHKGNARWVFAGRTTYIGYVLDLCNAIGLLDMDLSYEFTDLQGTMMYDFTEDTKMKISFYVGKDVLTFDPLYIDWGNVAVPFNFYHRFGDFDYNATMAMSRFYQTMELADIINIGMDLYTWAGKQWLNFRGITNHVLTAGYELEYSVSRFWEKLGDTELMDINYPLHHVFYVQDAWKFDPDWLLTYGVRLNYQDLAKHFGAEPRVSLNINLDEYKSIEIYGGYYLQYMNSIMFSDQESLNEFYYPTITKTNGEQVKPASSILIASEYKQRAILEDYDLITGVYYKTQDNLKTFVMQQDSNETNQSDDFVMGDYFGTAKAYSFGYELSLRKDRGAWFGGISWSQSLSVSKTNDGTEAYYPSWHQPYALKLDAGINWKGEDGLWPHKKKGRYLRSSVMLKYSAGMPYTAEEGYIYMDELNSKQYEDNIMVIGGSRNAARQTNYFRVDVKAIDMGLENKWNFSWTIINLTNHDNMFYSYYDTSKNPPEYSTISQFPFLPIMLSYEYYF